MLEAIKLYQQGLKSFNSLFVDPWFANPIAEYWMDQSIDIALKMYYWPAFAMTWEDRIKEFWFNNPLLGTDAAAMTRTHLCN